MELPKTSTTNETQLDKNLKKEVEEVSGDKNITKILDKTNPYLQTLLNPTKFQGIKIPDFGAVSTATMSVINNYQMFTSCYTGTGGVQGICGIAIGFAVSPTVGGNIASLIPNANNDGVPTDQYVFGITTNPGPTMGGPTSATTPFSGSPLGILSNGFTSDDDFVPSNAASIRLVSAEMEVVCLGSNFTNQGEVLIGYLAPYVAAQVFSSNASVDTTTLKSLPGIKTIPVAANKCWACRYVPQDNSMFDFVNYFNIDNSVGNPGRDRGTLICVVSGANTANTVTYDVKVTCNYEYVPKANYYNFAASTPTDVDPIGLALALNSVKSAPVAYMKDSMSENALNGMLGGAASLANFKTKSKPISDKLVQPKQRLTPLLHSGPSMIKGGVISALIPIFGQVAGNLTQMFSKLVLGASRSRAKTRSNVSRVVVKRPPPLPAKTKENGYVLKKKKKKQ
jgi:hypothetical protein